MELLPGFEPGTSSLPRVGRIPKSVQNDWKSAKYAMEIVHIAQILHILHQIISSVLVYNGADFRANFGVAFMTGLILDCE